LVDAAFKGPDALLDLLALPAQFFGSLSIRVG
jgi:hypothetical protein